jgi:hypothetical protein
MELLFEFLTVERHLDLKSTAETVWSDYQRGGRHDKPIFLREFLPNDKTRPALTERHLIPKRQARHLA